MALWSILNLRHSAHNIETADQVTRGLAQRFLPAIGDTVLLEVIPATSDRLPALYSARVSDLRARKLILAELKSASARTESHALDFGASLIRVSFAVDGHRYRFEVNGGRRPIRPLNRDQYAVTVPMRIDRVEQRRFFRMLLETPTWYRLETAPRHWRLPARIVDLSGGGMLLSTDESVSPGCKLLVQTPSGKDGHTVDMVAEVIDCVARSVRTRRWFAVRLKFVDGTSRAAEEERDAIVAYVFEQQRLMLRARKLTIG